MNVLKRLFHFLGGIYFALILIGTLAFVVIWGTFLEAREDSHLYAAQYIYSHPYFAVLLALFFVNILFSALRRWPFKQRHIPFLITHLGLLILITGCIAKNWYGLQGNMTLLEGSSKDRILVPHSYALHLEKREGTINIPIHPHSFYIPSFPELELKQVGFTPHVTERFETWIKGNQAYVFGSPPFPVQEWSEYLNHQSDHLVFLNENGPQKWRLIAIKENGHSLQEIIRSIYLQDLQLIISSKQEPELNTQMGLQEAIQTPQLAKNGLSRVHLNLAYSSLKGFTSPCLQCEWKSGADCIEVSLQGQDALYNKIKGGIAAYTVDLQRPNPILLFVQDAKNHCHLLMFDCHGRVAAQLFDCRHPHTMIAYDRGFSGYSVQAIIPFPPFSASREDKERADQADLKQQLKQAMASHPVLIPPLQLLKEACDQVKMDFPSTFIDFLVLWHSRGQLLFPTHGQLSNDMKKVMHNLNWSALPVSMIKGCQGVCLLFDRLDQSLDTEDKLLSYLEKNKWPFVEKLRLHKEHPKQLVQELARQMFSLAPELPLLPLSETLSDTESAHLLAGYFKAFGIDYESIFLLPGHEAEDYEKLRIYQGAGVPEERILETELIRRHDVEQLPVKLEDRRPRLFIEARQGGRRQILSLAYDASAVGLKWPFFGGQYLVRFQPQEIQIPYHVRLQQARQVYYPQSGQPYSYECCVSLKGRDGVWTEKTLSMNHVHETWDGYRFYLAGMATMESGIKSVQLVVNYDPMKYYLTYPGGIITVLGMTLLFWIWPYGRKN